MQPIKIKLTTDQIILIDTMLNALRKSKPADIQQKAMHSIVSDFTEKIHQRYRKLAVEGDIFSSKKTVIMQVKYHEVFSLFLIIQMSMEVYAKESKEHNDFLMLKNMLHQKLI